MQPNADITKPNYDVTMLTAQQNALEALGSDNPNSARPFLIVVRNLVEDMPHGLVHDYAKWGMEHSKPFPDLYAQFKAMRNSHRLSPITETYTPPQRSEFREWALRRIFRVQTNRRDHQ